MNRDSIYHLPEGSKETTFCYDDSLPSLPLPKLEDTLKRYFESLRPFGTEEELKTSSQIIEKFRMGVGAELHHMLAEKAKHEKNWVLNLALNCISKGDVNTEILEINCYQSL